MIHRADHLQTLRAYQNSERVIAMTVGTTTYDFHHDGLGSVAKLTSSAGVAQWTYAYLPCSGVRTENKNNKAPAGYDSKLARAVVGALGGAADLGSGVIGGLRGIVGGGLFNALQAEFQKLLAAQAAATVSGK